MEYSVELEFQVNTVSLPYITKGVQWLDGFPYYRLWQTPTGVLSTVIATTGCTDTVRVMSQSDPRVAHKQNNNSSPGFYPADFTNIR